MKSKKVNFSSHAYSSIAHQTKLQREYNENHFIDGKISIEQGGII